MSERLTQHTYELDEIRPPHHAEDFTGLEDRSGDAKQDQKQYLQSLGASEPEEGVQNAALIEEPIPDGGYGWVVVAACWVITFFYIGTTYAFGIIESRLIDEGLASSSTLSFVGGLTAACISFFAILNSNIIKRYGARNILFIGVVILGLGEILSSWTIRSVPGFFITSGFIMGIGTSLIFMPCTLLPSQYFLKRRGLAVGIVYSAGGVGGAVLSLVLDALIAKLGTAWTFRILGFVTWAACLPAVYFIKERPGKRSAAWIEWSLFKDIKFVTVFIASALGTFPLFVPAFFLPLYGTSMGLSHSSSAGLVAGFNLSSAVGRIAFGQLADWIGPINALMLAFAINAISLLLVWPLSGTLPPLIVFVVMTGVAAGAFFSLMPTVVASISDPATLPSAMGMTVTGWAAGYLLGAPIAGYLLDAYGGTDAGLAAYRPAMFYAGALTVASGLMLLAMKLKTEKNIKKKM